MGSVVFAQSQQVVQGHPSISVACDYFEVYPIFYPSADTLYLLVYMTTLNSIIGFIVSHAACKAEF